MRKSGALALLAGVGVLLTIRLLGGDDGKTWTGDGCDDLTAYSEEIAEGAVELSVIMQSAAQNDVESSDEIAAMVDALTTLRDRLRSMDDDGRVPPVAERYHQGMIMTMTAMGEAYVEAEDGEELLALLLSADGLNEARAETALGEAEIQSTCGSVPWES